MLKSSCTNSGVRENSGMPDTETRPGADARPHWLQVIAVGRNPRNTVIRLGILIAGAFLLFFSNLILLPVRVDGPSMLPTYKDHSVNFINRLAYLWHEPRRGDVVSIRYAGYHVMLLKRIIGLPGETVAFDDGTVLINGQPLAEPYRKWPSHWTLPPLTLSPNEYFIVGDNRTMRWQDHTFGMVERWRIVGKALL
jgi:signal peptidase I